MKFNVNLNSKYQFLIFANIILLASFQDCLATDYITVDNRNASAPYISSVNSDSSVPPVSGSKQEPTTDETLNVLKKASRVTKGLTDNLKLLDESTVPLPPKLLGSIAAGTKSIVDLGANTRECVKGESKNPCVEAVNSGAKFAKEVATVSGKAISSSVNVGLAVLDVGSSAYQAVDAYQQYNEAQVYRHSADVLDKSFGAAIVANPIAAAVKGSGDAVCNVFSGMSCITSIVALAKMEIDAYDEFGAVVFPWSNAEEIGDKAMQLKAKRASDRRSEFDQMQVKNRLAEENRRAVEAMRRASAEQERRENEMGSNAREAAFFGSMNSLLDTTMQMYPSIRSASPTGYQKNQSPIPSSVRSMPSGGAAPPSTTDIRPQIDGACNQCRRGGCAC